MLTHAGCHEEGSAGEVAKKRFEDADESRTFDHGRIDLVRLAGAPAARATFQPEWRWFRPETAEAFVGR